MPETWQIRVYDQLQSVFTGEVSGPVELGRQEAQAERLYSKRFLDRRKMVVKDGKAVEKENFWRIVIASREEYSVSRDHAFLRPAPGGKAELENVSGKAPIRLQDGRDLLPAERVTIDLPTVLTLGGKVIRILEPPKDGPVYQRLPESVSQYGLTMASPSAFSTLAISLPKGEDVEIEAIRWLKAAMGVLQSAVNSSDFFDKAARAIVESVGLDTGYVVLLYGDDWKTAAAWAVGGQALDTDQIPSRQILARVKNEQETLYHVPEGPSEPGGDSLMGVSAVVASPITVRGEVIGALYGDRRRYAAPGQPPRITKIDAMLVDILAASVAAGLARMEGERAAVAAQEQFKQFFTPELAQQIAARPELLKGQDSEITLLFADIRGFSRISERLGPARTVSWINDVMGMLSDCVLAHRGVLVDYIGDELMAMWGAPEEQPDHAELACRAAVDMLGLLPEMNARFLAEIGEAMDLGIGINTGVARVGNTGSKHKFKYGPLGNTVNLASRVQGITKYMKTRLLVTEATRERLGEGFASRRLGKVRVVNIGEAVNLYELAEAGDPQWEALCLQYESALAEFERKGFSMAARILATLTAERPADGPSLVLLSRAVNALVDPDSFDPVFVAPGK